MSNRTTFSEKIACVIAAGRLAVLIAAATLPTTSVLAQSGVGMDVFSRILDIVAVKAAQEAWDGESSAMRECLDESLGREGLSTASLANSGVAPSDPRLGPYVSQCNEEISTKERERATQSLLDLRQHAEEQSGQVDARRLSELTADINSALQQGPSDADVRALSVRLSVLVERQHYAREWNDAYSRLAAARTSAQGAMGDTTEASLISRFEALDRAFRLVPKLPPEAAGPSKAYELRPCRSKGSMLERLICSDSDTRWLILDYSRAYYLLRYLTPSRGDQLAQDSRKFQERLTQRCRVGSASQGKSLDCVRKGFAGRTAEIADELRSIGRPDLLEELNRPIRDHLQLQGWLQERGFLPADEEIDGVYGGKTRDGISQLQAANGLSATGVLDDATAQLLHGADNSGKLREIENLAADFATLESDANVAATRQAKADEAAKQSSERLVTARDLLAGGLLPPDLREFLNRYVSAASGDGTNRNSLDAEYDQRSDEIARLAGISSELNDRNRFLIESSGYVITYNATPGAPSVSKSLQGDLVYSGQPTMCLLVSSPPDLSASGLIREGLKAIGIDTIPLPAPCQLSDIKKIDIVVAEEGLSNAPWLGELLALLGDGTLKQASSIDGSKLVAERTRQQKLILDLDHAISSGSVPGGYGMFMLDRAQASICAVINTGLPSHAMIFEGLASFLHDEMGAEPSVREDSRDNAFIAAKRKECGIVYASFEDLALLGGAFHRDEVEYSILPVLVDETAVAKSMSSAEARQRLEAERQADAARRDSDEKALSAAKDADRDAVRERQQTQLRTQYGSAAKTFEDLLANETLDFVSGNGGLFAEKYPELASKFAQLLDDKWEYVSAEHVLLDYGTGLFKGRTLEVAFVRSEMKLRNRVLGEYQTFCITTGFVLDTEFQMDRDPLGVECDSADEAMRTYKLGARFASRWVVD